MNFLEMKNTFKILLLCIVAAMTVSCATQGNEAATIETATTNLKKGVTTKNQVHQVLGQPHDVRSQAPGSRWSYYYVTTKMNGLGLIPVAGLFLPDSNNTASIRHVYFDRKDRFQKSNVNHSKFQQNSFVAVANGVRSFAGDKQSGRVRQEMSKLGLPFDKKEAMKAKDAGTILGPNPTL